MSKERRSCHIKVKIPKKRTIKRESHTFQAMVDKHYVNATCHNEAAEHNGDEDHILQALP